MSTRGLGTKVLLQRHHHILWSFTVMLSDVENAHNMLRKGVEISLLAILTAFKIVCVSAEKD